MRADDRPDLESSIAVVDHKTSWDPPASAPKRQKLDTMSNGVRPSSIGRYVPPSLQESTLNGTGPSAHEAVRSNQSIKPATQQSDVGLFNDKGPSASILRTPFPGSDLPMEKPRPLTFGQVSAPAPAPAPPSLQYPYPGSTHRQTASVSEAPSHPSSTRPYNPSSFLDQPPARSASASTEAKANGITNGASRQSPSVATAPASGTLSTPSSVPYEPLRRESWTPRVEDKPPPVYSGPTSRYSPSWSHSAYASEASSYPYGRDQSSHRDYSVKAVDSQSQRASYYDEQPSRKRSLSPQPDQHRKPFFTSSYRPGADLPKHSSSPRPTPLTFSKPQPAASPSVGPTTAATTVGDKSPTASTGASVPLAAPATPAATPVAASTAPTIATPVPSPTTTTSQTLYVQSPTATPRSEVKPPFTPSSTNGAIPGLPSTRSPSAEKAAAVRLDRWVG